MERPTLRRSSRRVADCLLSGALLFLLALAACSTTPTSKPQESEDSGAAVPAADTSRFDGLVPVEGAKVGMAYIDPDADFSVFQRVRILEPYVAFRHDWLRDQNRDRNTRIRSSDVERIKRDVAALFKEVFSERLRADEGYEVVDVDDFDVLLLRPAIIDLDITAPDTMSAGRTRTFTTSSGGATLYIELFDSVSGAIVGRAADRQEVRGAGGELTWTNRGTNSAEARRMFRRWADQLRSFLDSHYAGSAN